MTCIAVVMVSGAAVVLQVECAGCMCMWQQLQSGIPPFFFFAEQG
jgi:hypothetical protein